MELYAATRFNGDESGNVYPLGTADNGKPARAIHGPSTQLNSPTGVALDNSRNLYVGNAVGASITVYAPDASGDAAPIRIINGDRTGLGTVRGVALDSTGFL